MARYTREQIIAAIQQVTAHDGGRPTGRLRFAAETGIQEHEWRGRYWLTWSDALKEAGFEPNVMTAQKLDDDGLLLRLALLTRRLGRFPTESHLKLERRQDPSFPSSTTFSLRFGRKSAQVERLREFADSTEGFADILTIVPDEPADSVEPTAIPAAMGGYVYLQRMGKTKYYKIGKTNHVGRRNYELGLLLPEELNVIHYLETDDPDGIEAYWIQRFKRDSEQMRGEWFALSPEDVAAFKRRGRFM